VPDVTVSILSMNGRDVLLDCLGTLVGAPAEIVVLDNASEDGSVDAIRERFPDVRVIDLRALLSSELEECVVQRRPGQAVPRLEIVGVHLP
jgi:hypothetical protein